MDKFCCFVDFGSLADWHDSELGKAQNEEMRNFHLIASDFLRHNQFIECNPEQLDYFHKNEMTSFEEFLKNGNNDAANLSRMNAIKYKKSADAKRRISERHNKFFIGEWYNIG